MNDDRIKQIQNFLEPDEAAIIFDDNNRFYFTGMRSSAGTVLITKDAAYLLIDFRYYEKAKKTVKSAEVILCEKLYRQLTALLQKHGIKTVLCETDCVTVAEFNGITKGLADFKISDSGKLSEKIGNLRSIKTQPEIESIKKAQALTDKTFDYILNKITAGVTEKEVMLDMEFFMRRLGSEGVSFDFIVVSGKNSSLPHGVPGDKVIEKGDFVTMDFGAVVNGYRSDMTRTVVIGKADEEMKTLYNTVLSAQLAAEEAIAEGVTGAALDKIARDIIDATAYKGCFGHSLGHGVGMYIHEAPGVSGGNTAGLKVGHVITIEPGIYVKGKYGCRIEDMAAIRKNGAEILTKCPKHLIEL